MPGEVETLATDEELAERADAYRKVSTHARSALLRRAEGATIALAVYQFEPGKRLRIPFELTSDDPLKSYTDAAIPALMPILLEIVKHHRAASETVGTREAVDAQLWRRFKAMAEIVKGVSG